MTAELRLASLVRSMTGVAIEPEKYYLFEQRFAPLMRDYQIENFHEMADKIAARSDCLFLDRVIEQITTHETRFFRDESFYTALERQILPEWLEKSATAESILPRGLKIWSAAASTGQEIWSVAIMIAEHFPHLMGRVEFYASDISADSLKRAEAGVFSAFEISRGMPPHLLLKYFAVDGSDFKVRKERLPKINFFRMNLLADPVPAGMDIVLCRNVSFYFQADDRRRLFSRIQEQVNANAILVLGSSESLDNYLTDYVIREHGLARYYEIKNPDISIFRRKAESKGAT